MPKRPGVYLMKDKAGDVLYVGKAKDLRARVRSYFSGGDTRCRVEFLMERVAAVETLVTEDERQALILEYDLIQQHKPRYNVRLKDDRSYLMVRVDINHEWPCLELVRQVRDDGARYFGPYAFGYEIRALMEVIRGVLPLRTCSDRVIYNRVRPCLEYQIKRCAGPCCLPVDRASYLSWVEQALQILEGKNVEVLAALESEMERASEELRFEDAAALRDRIAVLEGRQSKRPDLDFKPGARDAFGFYREGKRVEVSILMVRSGRLMESRSFGFGDVELIDEEVLGSIISQYYGHESSSVDEILLPFALEDSSAREMLLSQRWARRVQFRVPKAGAKARLLRLAQENARENFQARFAVGGEREKALQAIESELRLSERPRVIECVDISHLQGQATVASVVCFIDGDADKSRYRRFHLQTEGKGDDFAAMREVVMRHLSRAAEENGLSDLMVIDGGAAQLSQALAVRTELGLDRPLMVGLAKKRNLKAPYRITAEMQRLVRAKPERIYVEGQNVPLILAAESEGLKLLERIRDEAHRFALSFHRKTRSSRVFKSELEKVFGVGPKRRVELLKEFGSVRAIREADPLELCKRCPMPLKLAERIVAALKQINE